MFVLRWCLLNKYNYFYCRSYKSKKGAKYNLRLVNNSFKKYSDKTFAKGFFIDLRYVWETI